MESFLPSYSVQVASDTEDVALARRSIKQRYSGVALTNMCIEASAVKERNMRDETRNTYDLETSNGDV